MEPNQPPLSSVRLLDVFRIVFRHRIKSALVFVTMLAAVTAAAMLWPKTYMSDAKLSIRIGSGVKIDATNTMGNYVSPHETREREVKSIQEILKSRDLMATVVDEVGAAEILGVASDATDAGRLQERAINNLVKSIECTAPKNSNVMTIRCESRSAELAQRILSSYLGAYFDRPLHAARSSSAYEFFMDQSNQLNARLTSAKQELRDAKNAIGLVSVDGQRRMLESQISNLHAELLATQTNRASVLAKIAEIRRMHPDMEPVDHQSATAGSVLATDNMRSELYKLEIQKRDLQSRLSSRHPRVIAIIEQVSASSALLAQQELATAESELMAIRAKADELAIRFAEEQSELRALNENEVRITELERRVSQLDDSHRTYMDKLEQARIDKALAAQQSSNIEIAQTPSLIAKPTSPKPVLIIALGLIAGVLAAFSVAFLTEYFDDSFQSPSDVERVLNVPVVLSLPSSPRFFSISS